MQIYGQFNLSGHPSIASLSSIPAAIYSAMFPLILSLRTYSNLANDSKLTNDSELTSDLNITSDSKLIKASKSTHFPSSKPEVANAVPNSEYQHHSIILLGTLIDGRSPYHVMSVT